MTAPPPDIEALARARSQARAARDFSTADELRERIAEAGWTVVDVADATTDADFELRVKPPYDVLPDLVAVERAASPLDPGRRATVAVLAEGWPDDLDACITALVAHAPGDVAVMVLDVDDASGAGAVAHRHAAANPGRVEDLHVAGPVRFGPARRALLRRDTAPVHVWCETSTVLTGDALTPLVDAFDDATVVGAGWRGAAVDDDWHGFHDVPSGDVEAVLGYLFAMRTSTALAVADDAGSPFATARFYRNADIAVSFWLRDSRGPGSRLVVPRDLPVVQTRHRGFHDAAPEHRDRESKRNYDAFLARFRGRDDLRVSSSTGR